MSETVQSAAYTLVIKTDETPALEASTLKGEADHEKVKTTSASDMCSGEHIHIFILYQVLLQYRLSQTIEQISLCYAVGPLWLSILYIVLAVVAVQ